MITKEECLELKNRYNEGYRWIARDKNGDLYAFKTLPMKFKFFWSVKRGSPYPRLVCYREENILTCVTWVDTEPTSIADLINEYESHQLLKREPEKLVIPEGYTLLSDEWFAEHPDFPNKMNTNHSANVVIQNRGTGKTTHAIIASSKTGATIITHNAIVAKEVHKQAKYLGCNIPEPMSINQYLNTKTKPEKIIIDELELVLGEVLDSKIELITISK